MNFARRLGIREVFFAGALLAVSASSACNPKAGGACRIETKEVCVEDKKALACHDGKWEEMSCKGPDGCSKASGDAVCDQSVAEDKDVCNLSDDYVCSSDKKAMLQCVKNRWTTMQTCLGDRACLMEKKRVTCDNSIAAQGDACREDEDYACSWDKKSALVCRGGQFIAASLCKGPKGCKVEGDKDKGFKVQCDDSIANVGDACEKEEHFSCAQDERSILKCKNKKFDVEEKCRGKERCQIKGGTVGCF